MTQAGHKKGQCPHGYSTTMRVVGGWNRELVHGCPNCPEGAQVGLAYREAK